MTSINNENETHIAHNTFVHAYCLLIFKMNDPTERTTWPLVNTVSLSEGQVFQERWQWTINGFWLDILIAFVWELTCLLKISRIKNPDLVLQLSSCTAIHERLTAIPHMEIFNFKSTFCLLDLHFDLEIYNFHLISKSDSALILGNCLSQKGPVE